MLLLLMAVYRVVEMTRVQVYDQEKVLGVYSMEGRMGHTVLMIWLWEQGD